MTSPKALKLWEDLAIKVIKTNITDIINMAKNTIRLRYSIKGVDDEHQQKKIVESVLSEYSKNSLKYQNKINKIGIRLLEYITGNTIEQSEDILTKMLKNIPVDKLPKA